MTMWYSAVAWIMTLTLSLLVTPLAAAAQSAGKVPRLGVLAPGSPPGEPGRGLDRLRQGLRDLGYVEGQTIALEVRWDEQHPARWPDLATADLVQMHVDIIVAGTTAAALAAKQATSTIPIVIASSADPVGAGLVASLARPGGNLTGLSVMNPELIGKRLELLKEAVPGLARVALLLAAGDPRRGAAPPPTCTTSCTGRRRRTCASSSA